MIMKALEKHGKKFIGSEDNQPDLDDNMKIYQSRNILVISKIINFFIAEHFPIFFEEFENQGMKFTYLGQDDE